MLSVLPVALISYAGSIGQTQLESCATQNCQNVECHGLPPTPGTALTATGKTDGGLYTPCETISLTMAGGGENDEYALYASSGGVQLMLNQNGPAEVRAPLTGTLYLLGMRAANQVAVTYDTITLERCAYKNPSKDSARPTAKKRVKTA